ncbi:hypothetical protein MauCBS54593_005842 [Microsporum audouinii]
MSVSICQKEHHDSDKPSDLINNQTPAGLDLYPVFCTANIPSNILDRFIDESTQGFLDLVGDDGFEKMSPCIVQTTDLDAITDDSHTPMPEFESPFLNWRDDEVRDWIIKHPHPNFVSTTFTILDWGAIEKGLCRIGYIDECCPDDRMLYTDFYAELVVRVPIEVVTTDWEKQLESAELANGVYDRKVIEKEREKIGYEGETSVHVSQEEVEKKNQ